MFDDLIGQDAPPAILAQAQWLAGYVATRFPEAKGAPLATVAPWIEELVTKSPHVPTGRECAEALQVLKRSLTFAPSWAQVWAQIQTVRNQARLDRGLAQATARPTPITHRLTGHVQLSVAELRLYAAMLPKRRRAYLELAGFPDATIAAAEAFALAHPQRPTAFSDHLASYLPPDPYREVAG